MSHWKKSSSDNLVPMVIYDRFQLNNFEIVFLSYKILAQIRKDKQQDLVFSVKLQFK